MTQDQRAQWELLGLVTGALLSLAAVVRWPVKWFVEHAVINVMRERVKDLRGIIEAEFAHEIRQRDELVEIARANVDRIEGINSIVVAHGLVLRDMPRMIGAMEQLERTMAKIDQSVSTLNENMMDHGAQIGRVTGFIESREWQGVERRRKPRRPDGPHSEEKK